mmetsp:Transcript_129314/g.335328  ORF Transcript_129314/g.335328 Transcript_129314/m.335328 type:complete len:318 (-) Transcript_129314:119-1072(-)
MDEQHRLSGALLAAERICVLVRLPHHEVHIIRVRTQDLPIKAGILQLDFAFQVQGKLLRDVLRPGEQCHPCVAIYQQLVHHGASAVNQVHICSRKPNMVHHPQELLHAQLHLFINLGCHLVAHEDARHCLKRWNFQGEVERRDHPTPTKRHPDPRGALPGVVTRNTEGLRQVSDLVAGVVLQELASDCRLSVRLGPRLRRQALDEPCIEVLDVGLSHLLGSQRADRTEHVVAFWVLQWVMEPGPRTIPHALHERANLALLGIRHLDHQLSVHRINDVHRLRRVHPLPTHQVPASRWACSTHGVGVDGCPGRDSVLRP